METKQNLNMTVYRQARRERTEGEFSYTSYKGEDARPYVGDRFLFVADGLGGRSAMRHTTFEQGIFYPEKTVETLFKGIYDYEDDAAFCEYVVNSFDELHEFTRPEDPEAKERLRQRYFDNRNNLKKSAYFGSRIATAVFCRKMAEPPFAEGEVFDKILAAGDGSEEYLRTLGNTLAADMYRDIRRVAENGKFSYESSFRGLALLGTTLAAALYRECAEEGYVDVLYFVAGDSRPYMWDENGLRQTVGDQEGEDGGMTNFIFVDENESETAPFHIECKYYRFRTPCVVFTASDGVFDSKLFDLSSLSLEMLLLETLEKSESIEAAGETLYTVFDTDNNGAHDDSSTLALKAFGYADMEELRAAARRRLAVLKETYLDPLPGLLTERFGGEEEEGKRREILALKGFDIKGYTKTARNDVLPAPMDAVLAAERALRRAAAEEMGAAWTLLDEIDIKGDPAGEKLITEWNRCKLRLFLDDRTPENLLELARTALKSLRGKQREPLREAEALVEGEGDMTPEREGKLVELFATLAATLEADGKRSKPAMAWRQALRTEIERQNSTEDIVGGAYRDIIEAGLFATINATSRDAVEEAEGHLLAALKHNARAEAAEAAWSDTFASYAFSAVLTEIRANAAEAETLEDEEDRRDTLALYEPYLPLIADYEAKYAEVGKQGEQQRYLLDRYEAEYTALIK